jgi:hypothetical protein
LEQEQTVLGPQQSANLIHEFRGFPSADDWLRPITLMEMTTVVV